MNISYHTTDFESLTKEDLYIANSSILIVRKNNVNFHLKVHLKNNSKTLVAFSNGARDPKKRKPPFFSRSSWHNEIKSHCIFIDDPTLHNTNLRVGWALGDDNHYYLDTISNIIKKITALLEIPSSKTIYFGSSAGGFMSLMLASKHQDSGCVVNNPQFSINEKRLITFVRQLSPYKSDYEILNEYSERSSFYNLLQHTDYFPEITYILNRSSQVDIENQYNPFMYFLDTNRQYNGKVTIIKYHSEHGHGGMWDKDNTIGLLNSKILSIVGHDTFSKITAQISIPKSFKIRSKNGDKIKSLELSDSLYIPITDFKTTYVAEVEFNFPLDHGMMSLALISSYYYPKGAGNLRYEVYVNDYLLAHEDMALWKHENNINLFNLKRRDKISIKVRALSTKTSGSWEKASVLKIKDVNALEYESLIDTNILFTSKFMKMNKRKF